MLLMAALAMENRTGAEGAEELSRGFDGLRFVEKI